MSSFKTILGAALAAGVTLAAAASPAVAQATKQSAVQAAKPPVPDRKAHRLILQVNTNDAAMMNLALNNATNVAQYYQELGEKVEIEVVTFGPGLHMLRDDTSPVKARISTIALIPEAAVVKSGVVRVMELQEKGWAYVRP